MRKLLTSFCQDVEVSEGTVRDDRLGVFDVDCNLCLVSCQVTLHNGTYSNLSDTLRHGYQQHPAIRIENLGNG
jgi:hypothetical protein